MEEDMYCISNASEFVYSSEKFTSYELSASQLEAKVTLSSGKQLKMSY